MADLVNHFFVCSETQGNAGVTKVVKLFYPSEKLAVRDNAKHTLWDLHGVQFFNEDGLMQQVSLNTPEAERRHPCGL